MLEWLISFADKYLVDFVVEIILAALELFIGFKLVKLFTLRLEKHKSILKLDSNIGALIFHTLKIALNSLVIIIAVEILGVPSATIIAALGSCGLAVGLALQGGLSNLAGGVMIMIFKPFQCGDYICTTAGDGTVVDIGIFYTKLVAIDNRVINIPNSVLSSTTVTNNTARERRGIDIEVSVAYGSDIEKLRKALLSCADRCDLIMKDPAPIVFVSEHADSAVKATLRVSAKSTDYWPVRFELQETTLRAIREAGLEIPFPQVDVHMKD